MQVCVRCVMDETVPGIQFDKNGICNYCEEAKKKLKEVKLKRRRLPQLIQEIKNKGRGKEFDCLIGLSGGVDSSYTLFSALLFGLRPLVASLDNNWNSQIAKMNIINAIKIFHPPFNNLHLDWESFKDLQLSFLKASVPDLEIPTDHAITSYLFSLARKKKISYILTGNNVATESIVPRGWSRGHYDWKYIKNIHKRFGERKLRFFPYRGRIKEWFWNKKISWIGLLDYLNYDVEAAKAELKNKMNWKDYGWKHFESIYTRFIQAYILPKKFGFDKRKGHLSSLIISGKITRKRALKELKKAPYPSKDFLEKDKEKVLKELGLSEEEFERLMKLPNKSYFDYPHYKKLRDTRKG